MCVFCSCSSDVKDIDYNYQCVDGIKCVDSINSQTEISINNSIKLEGTKWIYELNEECFNYILFKKDNLCEFYSCELDEKKSGIYSYNENFIIIFLSDDELGGDNFREISTNIMQIKNDFLYFEEVFYFNGMKWEKGEIIDNYIFYPAGADL